ncbi:hypothetical protein HAX54_024961, partial [Datura stramonium]|nr:hypothetical protein [Datura stramonium]
MSRDLSLQFASVTSRHHVGALFMGVGMAPQCGSTLLVACAWHAGHVVAGVELLEVDIGLASVWHAWS